MAIFGKLTFWDLLNLPEILHLMIRKKYQKPNHKAKIKVKEFSSFATFLENPDFFHESQVVLLYVLARMNKVVEALMLITYSFRKRMDVLHKTPTFCGKDMCE